MSSFTATTTHYFYCGCSIMGVGVVVGSSIFPKGFFFVACLRLKRGLCFMGQR